MLIYHCHTNNPGPKMNSAKNERKSKKKGYKKTGQRKTICYSIKSVGAGESKKKKKSKVSRKKNRVLRKKKTKISRKKNFLKKNVQFLEGLGLKVKQQPQ